MHLAIKYLPLLLLLVIPQVTARTSDRDQPIHVEADSVEIREQEGVSIYRGNVKITRGSIVIKGELIHIHSDPQGVEKIVVQGKPASFYQLNDLNQAISAQSLHMTYSVNSGILEMKQDAVLEQSNNRFTSQHIVYNTQTDVVQAGTQDTAGPTDSKQRVTITIQPKKDNQPETDKQK